MNAKRETNTIRKSQTTIAFPVKDRQYVQRRNHNKSFVLFAIQFAHETQKKYKCERRNQKKRIDAIFVKKISDSDH